MKNKNYIVTAYRFGNRSAHSYTIGVFTKKTKAIKAAEDHTTFRGGKYICHVEEAIPDHYNNQDNNYTTTIYTTQ
jgi:hypothetical protein